MQILDDAIQKIKVRSYTPACGKEVVAAYQSGELHDPEECLYLIAELLGRINHD